MVKKLIVTYVAVHLRVNLAARDNMILFCFLKPKAAKQVWLLNYIFYSSVGFYHLAETWKDQNNK